MTTQMRRAKGSTTPIKFPSFDSPGHHGWTIRRKNHNSPHIWELRQAGQVIAIMQPSNDNLCNMAIMADDNNVAQWVEVTGDYDYITKLARQLHFELIDEDDKIFSEAIHWDGEPEGWPECEPETALEYYGLNNR